MTRHNYKLTINKPCRQQWNSMTNNDIGKYCSHCSKTVIDFTNLSDIEIIQVIEKSSGRLCGRLTNKQLNRPLYVAKPQSNSSKLYKILAGLILVGTSNNVLSTNKTPLFEIRKSIESENEYISNIENPVAKDSSNIVKGKVIDEQSKEPIPFASVIIKGTKTGVSTNIDGEFVLYIPDSLLTDKITISVNYIAYKKSETIINRSDLPLIKNILVMPMEQILLGEIEVVVKRKWWQRKK